MAKFNIGDEVVFVPSGDSEDADWLIPYKSRGIIVEENTPRWRVAWDVKTVGKNHSLYEHFVGDILHKYTWNTHINSLRLWDKNPHYAVCRKIKEMNEKRREAGYAY